MWNVLLTWYGISLSFSLPWGEKKQTAGLKSDCHWVVARPTDWVSICLLVEIWVDYGPVVVSSVREDDSRLSVPEACCVKQSEYWGKWDTLSSWSWWASCCWASGLARTRVQTCRKALTQYCCERGTRLDNIHMVIHDLPSMSIHICKYRDTCFERRGMKQKTSIPLSDLSLSKGSKLSIALWLKSSHLSEVRYWRALKLSIDLRALWDKLSRVSCTQTEMSSIDVIVLERKSSLVIVGSCSFSRSDTVTGVSFILFRVDERARVVARLLNYSELDYNVECRRVSIRKEKKWKNTIDEWTNERMSEWANETGHSLVRVRCVKWIVSLSSYHPFWHAHMHFLNGANSSHGCLFYRFLAASGAVTTFLLDATDGRVFKGMDFVCLAWGLGCGQVAGVAADERGNVIWQRCGFKTDLTGNTFSLLERRVDAFFVVLSDSFDFWNSKIVSFT